MIPDTSYHASTRASIPRTRMRSPTTSSWNTLVSISYVVPLRDTLRISKPVPAMRYMFQSLFDSLATHTSCPIPAVYTELCNVSKSSQLNNVYVASVRIGVPAVLTVKSNPSSSSCTKNKFLSYSLDVLKMFVGYLFSASVVAASPAFLNASNTGLDVIVASFNIVSINAVLSVAP